MFVVRTYLRNPCRKNISLPLILIFAAPSAPPAQKLPSFSFVHSFLSPHSSYVKSGSCRLCKIIKKTSEHLLSDEIPSSLAVMLPLSAKNTTARLVLAAFLLIICDFSHATDYKNSKNYEDFFNTGVKLSTKSSREKLPNQIEKSKVDVLGSVLKKYVESLRKTPNKELELVFLIDSSASVGAENFFNELKFVKKLLADFTVEYNATRVTVITFSSRNRVVKHFDHVSMVSVNNHKCSLFEEQLPTISYQGGGTYTLGAMLKAQVSSAVFLMRDFFFK